MAQQLSGHDDQLTQDSVEDDEPSEANEPTEPLARREQG